MSGKTKSNAAMAKGCATSNLNARQFAGLAFILGLCLLPFTQGMAQAEPASADSAKRKRVEIINTDLFEFRTTDSNTVRLFSGQVFFRHDGTDFHCDRATQFMDTEIMVARGNVHIEKPDSFHIYSDWLRYFSREKLAEFRGDVVFEDSTARLTTDSLDYDLNTGIGRFWGEGSLQNDSSVLSSNTGTYYHRRREAYFYGDVHLKNPRFDLYSDSMRYDTDLQIAHFIAPTRIVNGDDVIYCESGFYDTRTDEAVFTGNARMRSGKNRISADEIIYDKLAGWGEACGFVIWEDTVEQITILSHYAYYEDSLSYVMATEDPLLIDVTDGDTLYMSADTLITFQLPAPETGLSEPMDSSAVVLPSDSLAGVIVPDTVADSLVLPVADSLDLALPEYPDSAGADSIRLFYAYRQAKLLQGRMSGLADSVFFSTADSVFRLHHGPMMWVDTTQFSGDSMHVVLRNKDLHSMLIYRNALIVHQSAEGVYDQTRGSTVTGYFRDDELRRMEIAGNGESIYFIQDDSSAYVGGNKTLCSRMVIFLKPGSNEVDYITFLTRPEATFTPFSQINRTAYRLEGFRWEFGRKPHTVSDIVRDDELYAFYLEELARRIKAAPAEADKEAMPGEAGAK